MIRYRSGAAVQAGYYLNPTRWSIEPVARDGERLPEAHGAWVRVPALLALALAPVLGLSFLMFLPAVGFVLVLGHLARPVTRLIRRPPAAHAPAAGAGAGEARREASAPPTPDAQPGGPAGPLS